jgi:hypothetical protein
MKKLFHFVLAIAMILGLSAFTKKAPITVFMIGDSTMANKDTTGDKQERGWGIMLSMDVLPRVSSMRAVGKKCSIRLSRVTM